MYIREMMFHEDMKTIEQIAEPIKPNRGIKTKQATTLRSVEMSKIF